MKLQQTDLLASLTVAVFKTSCTSIYAIISTE